VQVLKLGLLALIAMRIIANSIRLSAGKFDHYSLAGESVGVRLVKTRSCTHGVVFRIAMADRLRFALRRETRFDRLGKWLGIDREWQTGDAGFDRKVFILCEDVAFNRALLRDAELREVCAHLLAVANGGGIECREGMLYLQINANGLDEDSPTGHVARFSGELEALKKLRACLERINASAWSSERDPSLTRKAWLVGVCVALGLTGIVVFIFGLGPDQFQVVREAIPRLAVWITLLVVAGLLLAAFGWLKSTPHTFAVVLDILLAAAPGCWMTTTAALTFCNQKLDRHTAVRVPVQVLNTYKTRTKGGHDYYLVVRSWPDPHGQKSMAITAHDFQWIKPGDCITARWHAGRLGDGWVSGYEPGCVENQGVER
jgi:hypothetical protein